MRGGDPGDVVSQTIGDSGAVDATLGGAAVGGLIAGDTGRLVGIAAISGGNGLPAAGVGADDSWDSAGGVGRSSADIALKAGVVAGAAGAQGVAAGTTMLGAAPVTTGIWGDATAWLGKVPPVVGDARVATGGGVSVGDGGVSVAQLTAPAPVPGVLGPAGPQAVKPTAARPRLRLMRIPLRFKSGLKGHFGPHYINPFPVDRGV